MHPADRRMPCVVSITAVVAGRRVAQSPLATALCFSAVRRRCNLYCILAAGHWTLR
jgi:hypothetical protein